MTARFKNIEFIKGDCLRPSEFSSILKESDGVIHTVGALLDGSILIDYKKALADI